MAASILNPALQQLGVAPETFGVSARLAMKAKQGQPALWQASGFEPLERFIRDTLDEGSRFRLKLNNPLGVAQALASRYAAIAEERLVVLRDDVSLLKGIESELGVHREDMARGHVFFEDTLRLGRVMDLFNRARVQKEFEDRVVSDAPRTRRLRRTSPAS